MNEWNEWRVGLELDMSGAQAAVQADPDGRFAIYKLEPHPWPQYDPERIANILNHTVKNMESEEHRPLFFVNVIGIVGEEVAELLRSEHGHIVFEFYVTDEEEKRDGDERSITKTRLFERLQRRDEKEQLRRSKKLQHARIPDRAPADSLFSALRAFDPKKSSTLGNPEVDALGIAAGLACWHNYGEAE